MGDGADYAFDQAMREEEEIWDWLRMSDKELKDACKSSRLPIVLSIRRYTKRLTDKQRRVLAYVAWRENYER